MTPTLETALAGLPAKPRVHELSKRIGISNKELLAALAERGLTITSASSSVPQAVAQAVIEALLGGQRRAEGQPPDGQPEPVGATEEPAGSDAGHGAEPVSPPATSRMHGRRRLQPAVPAARGDSARAGRRPIEPDDGAEAAPRPDRRVATARGAGRAGADPPQDAQARVAAAEAPHRRTTPTRSTAAAGDEPPQTPASPPATMPPTATVDAAEAATDAAGDDSDAGRDRDRTTPTTTRPRAAGGADAAVAAAAGWRTPTIAGRPAATSRDADADGE